MKFLKTASGRESILLALNLISRKKKKFVITQAFTCSAVPEAIISAGFRPLWVDIEMETYSFDLYSFTELLIRNHDSIGAILIQHTFGFIPKNYLSIKKLSIEYKIPIIEDRCHCNFLNDFSDISLKRNTDQIAYCYSFENGKPIKLGRGGLMIFNTNNILLNRSADKLYESANKASILYSLLNFIISVIYSLLIDTKCYWFLLNQYRKLANKKILPSNHNTLFDNLKINKMVFPQSLIISILIFSIKKRSSLKSKISKFLQKIINFLFVPFFKNSKRYPIFVNNKEKALRFCKKGNITVASFFNTVIQPLNEEDFNIVEYEKNMCKNAELASKHIISFEKKPNQSIINKLKML